MIMKLIDAASQPSLAGFLTKWVLCTLMLLVLAAIVVVGSVFVYVALAAGVIGACVYFAGKYALRWMSTLIFERHDKLN